MNQYQTTFEKLNYLLDNTLYSSITPKFFVIESTRLDACRYRHHCYSYSEKKYGKAVTIIRICRNCGLGIGEVFPPRKNRLSHLIVKHSETGSDL